MRGFFLEFLEHALLVDGRDWVLNTQHPTLADIHAAWIFDWMMSLEGAFSENIISEKIYPKTYVWCERYRAAVDRAAKKRWWKRSMERKQ
jgi:glutathione S-transferase